jgi:hypothetical protein
MATLFWYNLRKQQTTNQPEKAAVMKLARKQVQSQSRTLPKVEFADQKLSSFSGLVIFQALFDNLQLKDRLRACFRHVETVPTYDFAIQFLGLIVHILLGYRQLRDVAYYREDPMVLRLLGLQKLPNVATISRLLGSICAKTVGKIRELAREIVLNRLAFLQLRRVTLDFDGSVLGTCRHAEGTAVGFNRKKKGQRSYYPLFCTVAQTGQVLDFHHRPGNVHDSNGARELIRACVEAVRAVLPNAVIEVRMDSAFFSDAIIGLLKELDVEYTLSVPFERLWELKQQIESRKRWQNINAETAYFELTWKPKSWARRSRFLVIRSQRAVQQPGPLQLDLFVPQVLGFEFKVIVTNKRISARHVVAYHEGRGTQEAIFAELKSQGQMDYIPVRKLMGNQTFLLAVIFAHSLNRELQMQTRPIQRQTTEKRAPLWIFEQLATIRRRLIQQAGRLTRPQGRLTLTLGTSPAVKEEFLGYLGQLQAAY